MFTLAGMFHVIAFMVILGAIPTFQPADVERHLRYSRSAMKITEIRTRVFRWLKGGNRAQNDHERDHVKHSRQRKHCAIADSVIQQIADELSECYSAHCSSEAHQPRDRTDQGSRQEISRQNHDQS